MITVYECGGTSSLFDINGVPEASLAQFAAWLGQMQSLAAGNAQILPGFSTAASQTLNPALVNHVIVPYSAAIMPLNQSVAEGVAALTTLINETPGQFALLGFSQGALVCSNVYDQIRSGSLTARNSDFLGGVVMGNPRRQAGRTFPGCPDPGGEGALGALDLSGTETRWFEFANPGDLVCTTDPTSLGGETLIAVTNLLHGGWDGTQTVLVNLLTNPIWTLIDSFNSVIELLLDLAGGPHQNYGSTTPLAPADTRTCMQIGNDYFHSLALGWDGPATAPIATAVSPGRATVQVDIPTSSGTFSYSVQQFDVTTSTASAANVVSTSVAGGHATLTVNGLQNGQSYTFAVQLGTTYTNPSVSPVSTASNQITAVGISLIPPMLAATASAPAPALFAKALPATATATAAIPTPALNTVVYDATGTGARVQANSSSWTHTISGNAIIAAITVFAQGGGAANVTSVSVGGTPMTLLGTSTYNTTQAQLFQYGLLNPPTGTQTISMTCTGTTTWTAANSVSYYNVGSFGGTVTTAQSNLPTRSVSLSVGSAPNQMVAQAFATWIWGISGYNQTSRSYLPCIFGSSLDMLIGDAPGGSPVTFTAVDGTSTVWGAVATPLVPMGIKLSVPTATITAAIPTPAAGVNLVTSGSVTAAIPTPTIPIRWPLFDSVGAGGRANASSTSWSHTIGSNATALVVALVTYNSATFSTPTPTAKVGTTNLTQLGYVYNYWFQAGGGGNNASLTMFGMLNPPTGVQTITVSTTAGPPLITANSVAYAGVSGFGPAATVLGTSFNPSVSVKATSSQMVVQAFGGFTTALTDYSQTQRYNYEYNGTGTAAPITLTLVLGDSPLGSANPTFSTIDQGDNKWASVAIPLLTTASPTPPPGNVQSVAIPRAATR